MANKLSYSQLNRYKYCSMAWSYHYQHRVRPTAIPSALIFGSAIGKTFEYLLDHSKLEENVSQSIPRGMESLPTGEQVFNYYWQFQEVNGKLVDLSVSNDIQYLKSDHDEELASTPYEALRVKAHLMIKTFREEFLPLVTRVYSTEEKVELFSGEDSNVGYCDAVVDLEGYDSPVIMDFKTSGRRYDTNSVKESVQLSQYIYTLGDKYQTNLAGYAVFLKNINKNRQKICKSCGFDGSGTKFKTCNNILTDEKGDKYGRCNKEWTETIHPTCSIQVIIDEIPIEFQEQTVDEIGFINDQIKSGAIEKNFDACDNDFGKPCAYFNLCHKGSMEGLVILDDRK